MKKRSRTALRCKQSAHGHTIVKTDLYLINSMRLDSEKKSGEKGEFYWNVWLILISHFHLKALARAYKGHHLLLLWQPTFHILYNSHISNWITAHKQTLIPSQSACEALPSVVLSLAPTVKCYVILHQFNVEFSWLCKFCRLNKIAQLFIIPTLFARRLHFALIVRHFRKKYCPASL